MAQTVITDAVVTLNGNTISSHVTSVTINYNADMLEDTAMGDDTHSRLGGLKDWSMDIEIQQDYADNDIDEILFGLVGTTFTVTVKPASGSPSAGNPLYSGTAILPGYTPINGKVGDLAMTSISLQSAGTLSRAVA